MLPSDLIVRASGFHSWDAMAPAALTGILKRGPFQHSAETGSGGSTIVLSHLSRHHTVFAIEGENRTLSQLRANPDLNLPSVTFVEGLSQDTVPAHDFGSELDFVLLDGPHAYPLPQVEFAYLFPRLKVGGYIALDDIQIPSVHELFAFLKAESSVVLEEVIVRTAFFRRINSEDHGPDGWTAQGINRRPILRYSWRDRLRRVIKLH